MRDDDAVDHRGTNLQVSVGSDADAIARSAEVFRHRSYETELAFETGNLVNETNI